MKRFLVYALIIGCLGNVMLSSASPSVAHSTAYKLAQLGE